MIIDDTPRRYCYSFLTDRVAPMQLKSAAYFVSQVGAELVRGDLAWTICRDFGGGVPDNHPVTIEFYHVDFDKAPLLSMLLDVATGKIKLNNSVIDDFSGDWLGLRCLVDFLLSKATSEADGFLRSTVNSYKTGSGDHYVYRHTFPNGRFYIGKGRRGRALDFVDRNSAYRRVKDQFGLPVVDFLCKDLSDEEGYSLERKLIEGFREIYRSGNLLNVTAGDEKADVGDMPQGTLGVLSNLGKSPVLDDKYAVKVNIFRRFGEEIGSGKQYYKKINLVDAAKLLNCSLNQVLWLSEHPEASSKNGYRVLSDADFSKEVKRR